MSQTQIKKLSWWHDSIMNWIIENPHKKLKEAALHFEVTQSWLSTILHSDAFQDALATKREEHFSRVSSTLIEKVGVLADLAIEESIERLELSPSTFSVGALKDTTDMALKALGFGPKSNGNGTVDNRQLHFHVTDQKSLAEARGLMKEAGAAMLVRREEESGVIDLKVEEANGSSSAF